MRGGEWYATKGLRFEYHPVVAQTLDDLRNLVASAGAYGYVVHDGSNWIYDGVRWVTNPDDDRQPGDRRTA
jgi:hypothetical protein